MKPMKKEAEKNELISCLCCKNGVRIELGAHSVGEKRDRSGYEPLVLIDTSIAWICPDCLKKLLPHIQALTDLLDNNSVFWNGLPYLLKRKP